MPQGKGTYGSKLGRPPKKKNSKGILGTIGPSFAKGLKGLKKGDARESAIRRGGQKGRFSKFMGKMMTGKASPHTNRDESPLGKSWRGLTKSKMKAEKGLKLARSKMKTAMAKKKKG